MIRPARPEDIPAIQSIWNPQIRDEVTTFNSVEKTAEGLAQTLADKAALGHPFLVFEEGEILGFVTYGQFRGSNGYSQTMEHSIMLAPQAQGKGVGRSLMSAVEAYAKEAGVHSLWAGVSGENVGAIAFHLRCGYQEVATLPEVGRKFDRWFDLVLLQKILT